MTALVHARSLIPVAITLDLKWRLLAVSHAHHAANRGHPHSTSVTSETYSVQICTIAYTRAPARRASEKIVRWCVQSYG